MNRVRRYPGGQSGISYIEVLIAIAIIAVSLAPMLEALHTATSSSSIHEDSAVQHLHLIAAMENVLAENFASLREAASAAGSETVISSYSDSTGSINRRLVYLSLYDGDNADTDNDPFTGTDQYLMWVRVEIEGTVHAIETIVNQ